MAAMPSPEISTRDRLVEAAIAVFVAQGYEGARVQDIARAAGLTTGAIYANYRGKADLLYDAISALAGAEVDALLSQTSGREVPDALEHLGAMLTRRPENRPALLLDAVAAARRDPEVAELVRSRVGARQESLGDLFERARAEGTIDVDTDSEALAYYCTTLAMGALVMRTLELAPPDQDDWRALIHRLVGALAPGEEATR
jgi:AcrR family transcriptional regulator